MDTFDEAYAKYLNFLARLDRTDDISEKNVLFRQLTQLLSDLEHRLHATDASPDRNSAAPEERELTYWI